MELVGGGGAGSGVPHQGFQALQTAGLAFVLDWLKLVANWQQFEPIGSVITLTFVKKEEETNKSFCCLNEA